VERAREKERKEKRIDVRVEHLRISEFEATKWTTEKESKRGDDDL
jgi:hypothetical protein